MMTITLTNPLRSNRFRVRTLHLQEANDPIDLATLGVPVEIHALTVLMIIEMPPLYGIGSKVGIEETSTFAACAADARIDYSCCSDGTKLRTRRSSVKNSQRVDRV
jgi:hypothetical protein